jgi:hypothetical protein
VSSRHRRDFLLDSGAVTALATDRKLLSTYLRLLKTKYDGSLLIPIAIVGEFRTGDPRKDVPVNRLINAIAKTQETVYVPLTLEIAEYGGMLRTRAQDPDISMIDGYTVSTANDLADQSAVTILTGDPDHMKALVDITRRTNIAVELSS